MRWKRAVLVAWLLLWGVGAHAGDYAGPDLEGWYASLKQPDIPTSSCCGWGDAYFADKVDQCTAADPSPCALVAIITDDRPDELKLPDGRILTRYHRDIGERIPIPPYKLRKHPVENPTDHNVVFVSRYGEVYCWETTNGG